MQNLELIHMNKKKACIILPISDDWIKISALISRIFDQQPRIKSHRLIILVINDGSSEEILSRIKTIQTDYPYLYLFDISTRNLEGAYRKGVKYAIDNLDVDMTIRMNSYLNRNPGLLKFTIWIYGFKEFIKYCFVGALGAFVNMGLLILLTRFFQMTIEYASPIAIETAIISNFIFNNIWTFSSRTEKAAIMTRFFRFHMVALTAGLVNYIVLLILVYALGMLDIIANIIGIVSAMMVNYTLNSRWTWKTKLV